MSVELRPASIDDLDAILTLEESTFVSDAWSREQMAADLESTHTEYVVIERDGDGIVGYGGVMAPRGAEDADIQTIAIAPGVRRTGLGRTLMRELIERASRRGARRVFLEVREDNPAARSLYEELGFVSVGIRPRYYQPDDVDAVVMRLELAPLAGRPGPIGSAL